MTVSGHVRLHAGDEGRGRRRVNKPRGGRHQREADGLKVRQACGRDAGEHSSHALQRFIQLPCGLDLHTHQRVSLKPATGIVKEAGKQEGQYQEHAATPVEQKGGDKRRGGLRAG